MDYSLNAFTKPDLLTGNNKYEHEKQKIDAQHYIRIKEAPEILVITLRRFEYNTKSGARYKINTEFDISPTINLKHLMEDQNKDLIYDLKGIIIHAGTADSGHYISLVNNNRWYEYNDAEVSNISSQDAFKNAAAKGSISSANAYILVYTKSNLETYDDEKVVTYHSLKEYVPERIKEIIEAENKKFTLTQFAFSKTFLEKVEEMGIERELPFMINIAFHAQYDSFPQNFFDSILNDKIPSNPEFSIEFFNKNYDKFVSLLYNVSQSKLVKAIKDVIEKIVNMNEFTERAIFYTNLVDHLHDFINNKRNLSDALSLLQTFIYTDDETRNIGATFVDKLQNFLDELYTQSQGRSQIFISSIEIPDLFYILKNYPDKIDKEIIFKHASAIFLCPRNKGQFNQLLLEMYKNETIDIEELLKVCQTDITELWRDISTVVTSFDSPRTQSLIVAFLKKYTNLHEAVIDFIKFKVPESCKTILYPEIAFEILHSMTFSLSKNFRTKGKEIIFDAFPILNPEKGTDEVVSPNFDEFIDQFSQLWNDLPSQINENTVKQSDCFIELFAIFVKMIPFLENSVLDSTFRILEQLCDYKLFTHPNFNVYTLLNAISFFPPQIVNENISHIADLVIVPLEKSHEDTVKCAPEISAFLHLLESIPVDDDNKLDFIRTIMSTKIMQHSFEFFFDMQDNSPEFHLLLEQYAKLATSCDDQDAQSILVDFVNGINIDKLASKPYNFYNLIHASITLLNQEQCALIIINTTGLLKNQEKLLKQDVSDVFCYITALISNFKFQPDLIQTIEDRDHQLPAIAQIANLISSSDIKINVKQSIMQLVTIISDHSEKLAISILSGLLTSLKLKINEEDSIIKPIMSLILDILLHESRFKKSFQKGMHSLMDACQSNSNIFYHCIIQKLCNNKETLLDLWNKAHMHGLAVDIKRHNSNIILSTLHEFLSIDGFCSLVLQLTQNQTLSNEMKAEFERIVELPYYQQAKDTVKSVIHQ